MFCLSDLLLHHLWVFTTVGSDLGGVGGGVKGLDGGGGGGAHIVHECELFSPLHLVFNSHVGKYRKIRKG